jgi:hypothetical protein
MRAQKAKRENPLVSLLPDGKQKEVSFLFFICSHFSSVRQNNTKPGCTGWMTNGIAIQAIWYE